MTADDVKFTYDLLGSPNCRVNPDVCSSIADNVASTEVVDPLTVKFMLKQKYAPFIVERSRCAAASSRRRRSRHRSPASRRQPAASTPADVAALVKKVEDATSAENPACVVAEGATAPESCLFATYTAEIEAMLAYAGVELANKAGFNTGGESGTEFDPEAYAQGIFAQLQDLDKALGASSIDAIAQAQKIIDFGKNPIGIGPAEVRQVQRRPERRAGTLRRLLRWDDRCRSAEDPGQGVRGRHPQLGCRHRGSRQ